MIVMTIIVIIKVGNDSNTYNDPDDNVNSNSWITINNDNNR